MEAQLRSMRIVHGAMLFAAVLYVYIAEKLKPVAVAAPNSILYAAITCVAIALIGVAFFFRKRYVSDAEEKLRQPTTNTNPDTLRRWRAGHLVCFAFGESVVLYGLVLRLLGSATRQVVPFYVVGILLLIWFTPRRP